MTILNLPRTIAQLGTEAVLRYLAVSGEQSDDAIPEIFLGSFIAVQLYERFGCQVHIERRYTTMAEELGIVLSEDELTKEMGGEKADLAVYENQHPSHIVEFKIFKKGRNQLDSLVDDLEKAKRLAKRASVPVSAVLGLMICELPDSPLKSRIEELRGSLHANEHLDRAQLSADGEWKWRFACYVWTNNEGRNSRG